MTTTTTTTAAANSSFPSTQPPNEGGVIRPLINRPSNPIISMEEEDESNHNELIRLSQQEDQLASFAAIVAEEYNSTTNTNNNSSHQETAAIIAQQQQQQQQQQQSSDEQERPLVVEDDDKATNNNNSRSNGQSASAEQQRQQQQQGGPKVNFTPSTKQGDYTSTTTTTTTQSSSFFYDLNLSQNLSKRGNGYLASQSDLTSITSEQFAMGCTLLQLCAIGHLPTVRNYIHSTPYILHNNNSYHYNANNHNNSIINFRDYDRRTALHVASSEGHLDIVQYLVTHGAKINRSDRWGGSPLDDAHRHRHTDVARYLRSKGGRTGSVNLTSSLISAAAAGDIEEVRLIVESNDNCSVPIGSSGGRNNSATTAIMDLSGGSNKSETTTSNRKGGHNRSLSASVGGSVVKMRTGSFGGITVKAPTLDLSGSRKLGRSNSNPSSGGGGSGGGGTSTGGGGGGGGSSPYNTTNLDTSSSLANDVVVDINKGDYDHRTALHLAASEGHIDVVTFLCQRGANVNAEDRWGGRPLDDALNKDNKRVAEILREFGAKCAADSDEGGGSQSSLVSNHFHKSFRMSMKGSEVSDGEDENLRVDFSELEMIERIGSGAFGEIYKCRWRGILVAAKCIKASKIQKGWLLKKQSRSIADRVEAISQARITDEEKELALEDFRKETAIMRRLRHPNIVMMLAYSHTDDVEVMISEICRCSLLDIFRANSINNTHLPKRTQIIYAQQLAAGMNHLHKSRPPIIHRDLKPANLLIDFSGTLKIADFGLAKIRPNPEQNEVEAFQMTGETGSYRFMAPEVFRHEEYSETVDVYSYAMIFYYMLRGIPPWSGLSGVDAATKAAVDGERPLIPRDVDDRLSTLLKRCWDENPKARPGFDGIIISLTMYSHDVYKTDTDNPDWESHDSKCMKGGCVIS